MFPPSNAPELNQRLEAIRKTTVAFANLFSDIPFSKYNNITGQEIDRIKVPIIYGDKEKYVKRMDIPQEKVQITLPRIEYGLINMEYDASRRTNHTNKIVGCNSGASVYVNSPLPYLFNFEIVLYTRNIEDANQILEYILPHFYPDYNLKINFIPEAGITKNVPITFTGESEDGDSQGVFDSEVRSVFRTLQFTARSYIFQPPKYYKPILHTITNIYLQQSTTFLMLDASGSLMNGDIVFQGDSYNNADAKAIVMGFIDANNKTLQVTTEFGTFTANTLMKVLGKSDMYTILNVGGNSLAYSTYTTPLPNTYPVSGSYDYIDTITDNTN